MKHRFAIFTAALALLLATVYGRAQLPGTFLPTGLGPAGGLACTPNTDGGGNDANVMALWHFDNNLLDSGLSHHNGTVAGAGGGISAVQSKFGGFSYLLSAYTGALNIGASGDYAFGGGDFTYEFWGYLNTPSQTYISAFGNYSASELLYQQGTVNTPSLTMGSGFSWSYAYPSAQWTHYAFVRHGTTLSFFANGTKITPDNTLTSQVVNNTTSVWQLGNIGSSNGNYWWPGYLDEFRISNVARYTANFTPQTTPFCNPVPPPPPANNGVCTYNTDGGGTDANVVALWHMDNNGNNGVATGSSLTLNGGAAYSTTQSKFGGYALKITTAGTDFASVPGTSMVLSGDFTAETWLYFPATFTYFGWMGDDQATNLLTLAQPQIGTQIAGGSATVTATSSIFSGAILNSWHHVVWQRQGTNFRMWLDGVEQAGSPVGSVPTGTAGGSATTWKIGRAYSSTYVMPANSYMDEVRVSNVARYTNSRFTPPIYPFCNPAAIAGHQWNSADMKPTYTVLSNNNYDIVSSTDSAYAGARATKGLSAGKFYFEIKLVSAPGLTTFGIADSTFAFANYVGVAAKSAGFRPDGGVAFGSSGMGTVSNGFTTASPAINDVYGFAVDLGAGQMWVSKNNVWLGTGSPNPATGTAPNLTAIPAGTVFPVDVPLWTGTQDKTRLQDGVGIPLTYTPPTGFTAYGSM